MRILRIALALLLVPALAAALEVPYLSGRVNDQAALLSSSTEDQLERRLESLEDQTGAQVAVLTLPSLEEEPLEDFSIRVVETWKLGQKGEDNGVLILVVRDERQVRIEVGYGLEGQVPDILANRIIDDSMVPRFRQGDFGGGISAAVDDLTGLIGGDPEVARRLRESPRRSSDDGPDWIMILFVVMVILFSMFGKRGRRGGIFVGGGGGGGFSFGGGGGGFSGGGGSFGGGGASGSW